jgi:Uma2 family endonuclease
MKVRIRLPNHVRFYYPDASVICRSGGPDESFQDEATVVFEVLSRATRRIDETEKKDAYLQIPTLEAYVMLEQESVAVQIFRRSSNGFIREVYKGPDAVISFPTLGIKVPLSEIYEGWESMRVMEEEDEYAESEYHSELEV